MNDVRVVAEWGQSHAGSLDRAIAQADATKHAGAWAAKWQAFDPARIASRYARRYWDPTLGGDDSQLRTFTDNGNLSVADWARLRAHCRQIGVEFICTPFDLEAVDMLETIGAGVYKIASGDITNKPLLLKVASTGKPIILSTGAANMAEIRTAVLGWLWNHPPVTVLACTLSYPTADTDAHLGRIETLRRTFPDRQVGYSDHTLGWHAAGYATALGATVLEKHCTLGDGNQLVPDDRMALNPFELSLYVQAAQRGALMRGNPKLIVADAEQAARVGARRCWYATRDIRIGDTLTADDLIALRPYHPDGFEPVCDLAGKVAAAAIAAGNLVRKTDVV